MPPASNHAASLRRATEGMAGSLTAGVAAAAT